MKTVVVLGLALSLSSLSVEADSVFEDVGNAVTKGANDTVNAGKKAAGDVGRAATGAAASAADTLNPVNNVKRFGTFVAAVGSGDTKKMQTALGDIALHNANCLSCDFLAKTALPNLTSDQIHSIAGRGLVIFVTTRDPYLTFLDTANNVYQETKMAKADNATPPTAQPATASTSPTPRTLTGSPECIFKTSDGRVWAMWKENAALTNGAKTQTFPAIDIDRGDIVKVTATDTIEECQTSISKSEGVELLSKASLIYDANNSATTSDPNALKFWIYGASA